MGASLNRWRLSRVPKIWLVRIMDYHNTHLTELAFPLISVEWRQCCLVIGASSKCFFSRIALVLFSPFFHICSHSRKEDEKSNSNRAITCLGVLKRLVGMAGNTWYYVGKASIQLSQCPDCAMLHRLAPRSASEWGKKRRVQSKQNGWTTIQLMLFSLPR